MNTDPIDRIIEDNTSDSSNQGSLNEEYLNDFLIETREHLESIETYINELEKNKYNDEIIAGIFRDFHTIKGLAGFVSQSFVQKIAHRTESALDKCRKSELEVTDNLIKLILKSTEYIKNICENLELNEDKKFIDEVSVHLFQLENIKAQKSDNNEEKIDKIIDSIIEKENKIPQKKINESVNVRVPIKKIDTLVEMVGELVINYSQFERQMIMDNKTEAVLHRISTLTKEIENLSMSLRMVSLKSVFQRIYRIGKDTVSALDKKADIIIKGENTEIDRGVVEKLVDPLIHLIKNSIYHGIENEPERMQKGKPPVGTVTIEAFSTKGNVYIIISDDGRGIDTGKIMQAAINKNFADPFIDYSEKEILDLIFLPGFSTLDKADNISGRGVGLDVVKTQIAGMGGKVDVKNIPGEGCSFIIKIPINMAIIKGTVVEIAGTEYIVPMISIKAILKPSDEQWISVKGIENLVKVRDDIIPIININEILGLENFDKSNCMLLVLESDQKLKAMPVDRIIENRDVVVKSLGSDLNNIDYAFGASILGNGRVAIIFNIENIVGEGD